MPQAREKTAQKKTKPIKGVSCGWSSCKKEHPEDLRYPKGGKTTKGGYRAAWIAAGEEPWRLYGNLRMRLTKNGKAYQSRTFDYQTQAHHLIPTTLINKLKKLVNNLELIGYDCDEKINGMILPEFKIDAALHELPCHRGNHPSEYMDPILNELKSIEKDYDGICESDLDEDLSPQAGIIQEMYALSCMAKGKILNIRTGQNFWPLRKDALAEFNDAQALYEERRKLYELRQNLK